METNLCQNLMNACKTNCEEQGSRQYLFSDAMTLKQFGTKFTTALSYCKKSTEYHKNLVTRLLSEMVLNISRTECAREAHLTFMNDNILYNKQSYRKYAENR